jgi:phosphatidate cytidylyltransferase
MRDRLLLGPVLIALLLGAVWLDERIEGIPILWLNKPVPPGTILFLVMTAISVLAARELAAILAAEAVLASKRVMTFAAMAGLVVSCVVPAEFDSGEAVAAVATVAMIVLAISLGFYSRHKSVEGVVAGTGGALLGFVYLGLMFGFLLAIRRDHSGWVLLWVLLTTKSCDIGAYFTGKAIGRHKLIPWVSPGKTWEGLAGGVVAASLVSCTGLEFLAKNEVSLWWGLIPGAVFALVGQAGDLMESTFKRDAGIKDSGPWVPGFGGVLDLIDSPLLVGPVAYWILRAFVSSGGGWRDF